MNEKLPDWYEPVAELAQRVAESEQRIAALESRQLKPIDYKAPYDTPEQCAMHGCTYYTEYGGPEAGQTSHRWFHAFQRKIAQLEDALASPSLHPTMREAHLAELEQLRRMTRS